MSAPDRFLAAVGITKIKSSVSAWARGLHIHRHCYITVSHSIHRLVIAMRLWSILWFSARRESEIAFLGAVDPFDIVNFEHQQLNT
ncbi:hypothetical protein NPIL_320801 [Nephila pilipes]|uniref:Uncharacterized protein n=1 Tax=Nephila pilipes TaxID=299642 RepID=A0A8X6NID4_NEPPI|nr:hypothetical protein NPIL_320801 [Nephila pilipes]